MTTPRTEAVQFYAEDRGVHMLVVTAETSRKLEEELNAANARVKELEKQLIDANAKLATALDDALEESACCAEIHESARISNIPARVREVAERICQSVAEIPYRDSPADQPEMMLVTGDELMRIVERELEDLYTQSQRELAEAQRELAEVKARVDRQEKVIGINCSEYTKLEEERDRYRECVERIKIASEAIGYNERLLFEVNNLCREAISPTTPPLPSGDTGQEK